METSRNKKYKYIEKNFDPIHTYDEDDKNKELLDPNYTPEMSVNHEKKKFIYEDRHQQMNYASIKEYHVNDSEKIDEDYLERRKLIGDHNINIHIKKGTVYSYGEEENISINVDDTKECSEVHYHFNDKFPREKK